MEGFRKISIGTGRSSSGHDNADGYGNDNTGNNMCGFHPWQKLLVKIIKADRVFLV
jgi:hypothetical protein